MTERVKRVCFCLCEGKERKSETGAKRSLLEWQTADAEACADEQTLMPRQLLRQTPDPTSDETRHGYSTDTYRLWDYRWR
jgi:hypothetical protein